MNLLKTNHPPFIGGMRSHIRLRKARYFKGVTMCCHKEEEIKGKICDYIDPMEESLTKE